jgi:hypothetical protein
MKWFGGVSGAAPGFSAKDVGNKKCRGQAKKTVGFAFHDEPKKTLTFARPPTRSS